MTDADSSNGAELGGLAIATATRPALRGPERDPEERLERPGPPVWFTGRYRKELPRLRRALAQLVGIKGERAALRRESILQDIRWVETALGVFRQARRNGGRWPANGRALGNGNPRVR